VVMHLIKQETNYDCCAAVLAMLLDCSLADAKLEFMGINLDIPPQNKVFVNDMLMILARKGYWVSPFWKTCCTVEVVLPQIKGPGFAMIQWNASVNDTHLVAISENNLVLDPMKDEPRQLNVYDFVFIAAVRKGNEL